MLQAALLSMWLAQTAGLEHSAAPDVRPNSPVSAFGLNLPFKTAPSGAPDGFAAQFQAGNTWIPTVGIEYPGTGESTEYLLMGAKGVVRSANLQLTHKLGHNDELTFGLDLFRLDSGDSPADAVVSDRFIESVHRDAFNDVDPFGRVLNQATASRLLFRDRRGRQVEVKVGQTVLGTLAIGNTRYFELVDLARIHTTLHLATFVGIPLSDLSSYVSAGVSVGVANTVALTSRVTLTTAGRLVVEQDNLLKVRQGLQFNDLHLSEGYSLLVALNRTFGGVRISGGFELRGKSPPLSAAVGTVNDALGAQFNPGQASDTQLWRSYESLTDWAHYVTVFLSVRPGPAQWVPTFALYVQEDWRFFPHQGGKNPVIDGGNNAQDLGVGMRIDVPFDLLGYACTE